MPPVIGVPQTAFPVGVVGQEYTAVFTGADTEHVTPAAGMGGEQDMPVNTTGFVPGLEPGCHREVVTVGQVPGHSIHIDVIVSVKIQRFTRHTGSP